MADSHPSTEVLPTDVIAALKQGRKIEAIRRLREARNVSLKDAKHLVDGYVRTDPVLRKPRQEKAQPIGRILWMVALGAAVWFAYRWLQELNS